MGDGGRVDVSIVFDHIIRAQDVRSVDVFAGDTMHARHPLMYPLSGTVKILR